MADVKNLKGLFTDELKDIYYAENKLINTLPKMAQKTKSSELKNAIQSHLEETKVQKERLEKVFAELGTKAEGKTCHAMEGLVKEGEEIMDETDGETLDAGIISAAQKVEHYEIASYGTLVTWAKQLGLNNSASLLEETLKEEKNADSKLTKIAQGEVNKKAEK